MVVDRSYYQIWGAKPRECWRQQRTYVGPCSFERWPEHIGQRQVRALIGDHHVGVQELTQMRSNGRRSTWVLLVNVETAAS